MENRLSEFKHKLLLTFNQNHNLSPAFTKVLLWPKPNHKSRLTFLEVCTKNIYIWWTGEAITKRSLEFEYFTECKHHIASVKSWNKLIHNKISFQTLKLWQGNKRENILSWILNCVVICGCKYSTVWSNSSKLQQSTSYICFLAT